MLAGAWDALEARLGDPLAGVSDRELARLEREDEEAAHDPEVLAALAEVGR
jgi:hypothetical protein